MNIEEFLTAYIEAALWSSSDESTPQGGEPFDYNYGRNDIHETSLQKMRTDCAAFIEQAEPYLYAWTAEQAGHDFWLTRNRHGAGFRDRRDVYALPLTVLAQTFRERNLVLGDDGKIHCEG
jgi:hypothetical protein